VVHRHPGGGGRGDVYQPGARNQLLVLRPRALRWWGLLQAGDVDYRAFQTIVYRTDLITDDEVMAAVDGELAAKLRRWSATTRSALGAAVDRIVARADLDAGTTPTRASSRARIVDF
jgi:hypothetical protein